MTAPRPSRARRCACCLRRTLVTVDDSGLCVSCDVVLFPAPRETSEDAA